MRIFLRLLGSLLALALLAIVAVLASLLFTAHGGPWAFRLAAELSKGQLKAEGVHGGLLDTLDIDRLTFTSATEWVVVSQAHLQWNPRELRARTLHLLALRAASVEVTTYPSPPKPFIPLPVKLPLTLVLDDARVAQITVHPASASAGEAPITLKHFAAVGRWDEHGLTITRLAAVHPQFGAMGAAGLLRLEADAVHFQPLAFAGAGGLQLRGTLGLNGRASSLSVEGDFLRWPLSGKPQISATRLHANFAGTGKDARLSLSTQLRAAAGAELKSAGFMLNAEARLRESGVEVSRFTLVADDARQGQLSGNGTAVWQPALKVEASLLFSKLNPGLLLPDWPGRLQGSAQITTTLEGNIPRLRFTAKLAQSQLRGRVFALQTEGTYLAAQPAELAFDTLNLKSGGASLAAKGRVLPEWQAEAQLRAANLRDLYPGLSGSADARVKLAGAFALPRMNAEAEVHAVKYQALALQQAQFKAAFDPAKPSSATLTAEGMSLARRRLNTLNIAFNGTAAQHQIKIASTAPEGTLAMSLRGGYRPTSQIWSGSLESAAIDAAQAPKMTLTTPAALMLSAAAQSLSRACFEAGTASACLTGRHAGTATEASFTLSQFALATLQPLLPKGLLLDSVAEGQGRFTLSGSLPTDGNLLVTFGAGRIVWPEVPVLMLRSARLSAKPAGSNWSAELRAETDHGSVQASANTPRAGKDWAGRPLAGKLALDIPSLAFLQGLVKGTEALDGRVQGALVLAGTLARPRFTGTLRLDDGQARIPQLGLKLSHISAAVAGSENGVLGLEAQLQSGDGILKLAGTATTAEDGVRARISAKGENLQVADLADYRVWASPDLLFVYAPAQASVTGSVDIPRAAITPRKLAGGVVRASPDAVVAGREKPAAKSLPINAEVRVSLGKDVRFEGFGLKARFEGAVTATDAPGLAVTRGRGELRVVEGRYKAYGQDLTLQTGRLLFTGGPIIEPTVDFRAVRQLREDLSVSVLVRGSLAAPRLDLSSSPAMSREEQLSWLVLGRPLSNTTGAERSQVNTAALSLGLSGGELLAGRLGKTLGFDDISIGSQPGDDVTQARFTIGKYVSPKLYVSYGLGLFERNNVFRLLYDLGHGFKLRTETGLHAGGDVLYTVEK